MKRSLPVPTLRERASGVLLHVTSLPGPRGDLGEELRDGPASRAALETTRIYGRDSQEKKA